RRSRAWSNFPNRSARMAWSISAIGSGMVRHLEGVVHTDVAVRWDHDRPPREAWNGRSGRRRAAHRVELAASGSPGRGVEEFDGAGFLADLHAGDDLRPEDEVPGIACYYGWCMPELRRTVVAPGQH